MIPSKRQHTFQRAFSSPTSAGWFREQSKGFSPKSDDSDHSMHSDEENHIAMETDCVMSDMATNLSMNSLSMSNLPLNKTYTLNTPSFPTALTPTIGVNQRTYQDASSKSLQIGRPVRAMGLKDVDLTKSKRAEELRRAKEDNRSKNLHIFSPVRQNSSPAILGKPHQCQQARLNKLIEKSPEEKFFPALSEFEHNRPRIKPDLSIVPYDTNTARNRKRQKANTQSELPKLYSMDINQQEDYLDSFSVGNTKHEIEVIEIDDDYDMNEGMISKDEIAHVSPISSFQHNITTRKPRKRNPTKSPAHRLTSFSDEEDDDDDKVKSSAKGTNVTKSSDNKTSRSTEKQKHWSLLIGSLSMFVVVIVVIVGTYLYLNSNGFCLDNEFQYNMTGLEYDLKEVFYGQHLAMKVLLSSLRSHKQFNKRNKPLVLSLHGWTGTGKNYVSGLIAKHLFKHGINSKFIHKFIVPLHFPHVSEVDLYKKQIHDWILSNITSCSKGNLFIFDEMDKIPPGIMTVLKPFLDPKGFNTDTVFNSVIFLFLSNAGAKLINNFVLKHYMKGLERESIELVTLEELLHSHAEENSELWYHDLVKSAVIDHFVPFLPLERSHVKQCIRKDMRSKGYAIIETMVREVADEMNYFPDDLQLFSVSGCKKVSSKVDVAMG